MRRSASVAVGKPQSPAKGEQNMEIPITDLIQRLAVNSIIIAFEGYGRRDLRTFTREKRAKAFGATWILFRVAIDTLADRPVDCDDPPTKLEAADWLKQLVVDVPNNLSDASRQIAIDAITVLVALLPVQQGGGFVN